jgi:flagellar biosynthetic protein FliP
MKHYRCNRIKVAVMTVAAVLALSALSWAEPLPLPTIQIGIGQAQDAGQVSVGLQILFILTILSLAPSILILLTSFTRIIVVFSFLRQALGTQQMPPNQVMIGLALFLTVFIMAPVWQDVNKKALQPFLAEEIDRTEALHQAEKPIRTFMLAQTREKDLAVFYEITKKPKPKSFSDVPTSLLIPAFVISELRTAFQIGFLIYIPFLVLDMVVASVLLSMGMMMLPPVMISLPFKLLLFVLVDGWNLMVGSLVKSFLVM